MLTRFFLAVGMCAFDLSLLIPAAGTTEAFVWAGLLLPSSALFVLTAYDLQNER